jgi:uncharacterized protein
VGLRVTNRTRVRILGDQVQEAKRFTERFVGLMGQPQLPFGKGLLLSPCNSIHTFFMRAPIDVLFLDAERRIVKMIPALPPWRATSVYWNAKSVLELPAGTLAASETQEGDELAFEET